MSSVYSLCLLSIPQIISYFRYNKRKEGIILLYLLWKIRVVFKFINSQSCWLFQFILVLEIDKDSLQGNELLPKVMLKLLSVSICKLRQYIWVIQWIVNRIKPQQLHEQNWERLYPLLKTNYQPLFFKASHPLFPKSLLRHLRQQNSFAF